MGLPLERGREVGEDMGGGIGGPRSLDSSCYTKDSCWRDMTWLKFHRIPLAVLGVERGQQGGL